MRRHWMMRQLEVAAGMVQRDDGLELVVHLEGWRFGPPPHLRARRLREQPARWRPAAPPVSAPGMREGDDVDGVWRLLVSALEAHAA